MKFLAENQIGLISRLLQFRYNTGKISFWGSFLTNCIRPILIRFVFLTLVFLLCNDKHSKIPYYIPPTILHNIEYFQHLRSSDSAFLDQILFQSLEPSDNDLVYFLRVYKNLLVRGVPLYESYLILQTLIQTYKMTYFGNSSDLQTILGVKAPFLDPSFEEVKQNRGFLYSEYARTSLIYGTLLAPLLLTSFVLLQYHALTPFFLLVLSCTLLLSFFICSYYIPLVSFLSLFFNFRNRGQRLFTESSELARQYLLTCYELLKKAYAQDSFLIALCISHLKNPEALADFKSTSLKAWYSCFYVPYYGVFSTVQQLSEYRWAVLTSLVKNMLVLFEGFSAALNTSQLLAFLDKLNSTYYSYNILKRKYSKKSYLLCLSLTELLYCLGYSLPLLLYNPLDFFLAMFNRFMDIGLTLLIAVRSKLTVMESIYISAILGLINLNSIEILQMVLLFFTSFNKGGSSLYYMIHINTIEKISLHTFRNFRWSVLTSRIPTVFKMITIKGLYQQISQDP